MEIKVDQNLLKLAQILPEPLYIVGGYVRDCFFGSGEEADIDLSSANTDEDFLSAVKKAGFFVNSVYKRTGTFNIISPDKKVYEYTKFRTDSYFSGGGHAPKEVVFTKDIEKDARRRDFKCNALYYDLKNLKLVDVLGSVEDIKNKRLSAVTEAEKVFAADGLRLLRLCRFSGELGFTPANDVINAAKKYSSNIKDISPERIFAELNKMAVANKRHSFSPSNGHYIAYKTCEETGVLDYILPELTAGKNMPQRSDFHKYDVLEHSLKTLLYADEKIRIAALLHDIGKPTCMQKYGKFYGHETVGAKIAEEVLNRLKAPKNFVEKTCRLIKAHMLDLDLKAKENTVRRYIYENYDILEDLYLLKQADFSACKDDLSFCPTVKKWKEIEKRAKEENIPFTLKELNIYGNDLKEIGFKGEAIGKTLKEIFFSVLYGNLKNEKKALLERAEKIYKGEKK